MQLAKSEAVKKNLIQTWTGRLHLPQIDFCKSRVSNIRSQNALIDIRDPRSSAAVQKCFHNPPEPIHSHLPVKSGLIWSESAFLCRCGVVQIIIYYHNSISKKNGFSNIRCTLWLAPSPALHQEIEEEGEEHQKGKQPRGRPGQTGETRARSGQLRRREVRSARRRRISARPGDKSRF